MGDYKPKVGDRVRVVIEGDVGCNPNYVDDFTVSSNDGPYTWVQPNAGHVVSVEKIEPPVTVFKPGDVVRHKKEGTLRALGTRGYVRLNGEPGAFYAYDDDYAIGRDQFTSEKYELVDLA